MEKYGGRARMRIRLLLSPTMSPWKGNLLRRARMGCTPSLTKIRGRGFFRRTRLPGAASATTRKRKAWAGDRKRVGEGKRGDLGGRRIIKKKKHKETRE